MPNVMLLSLGLLALSYLIKVISSNEGSYDDLGKYDDDFGMKFEDDFSNNFNSGYTHTPKFNEEFGNNGDVNYDRNNYTKGGNNMTDFNSNVGFEGNLGFDFDDGNESLIEGYSEKVKWLINARANALADVKNKLLVKEGNYWHFTKDGYEDWERSANVWLHPNFGEIIGVLNNYIKLTEEDDHNYGVKYYKDDGKLDDSLNKIFNILIENEDYDLNMVMLNDDRYVKYIKGEFRKLNDAYSKAVAEGEAEAERKAKEAERETRNKLDSYFGLNFEAKGEDDIKGKAKEDLSGKDGYTDLEVDLEDLHTKLKETLSRDDFAELKNNKSDLETDDLANKLNQKEIQNSLGITEDDLK